MLHMMPVIRIVGNLEVMHVLTQDVGIYEMYDFPKRLQGLPVTGSWHWTLVQGTQRQEGPKR